MSQLLCPCGLGIIFAESIFMLQDGSCNHLTEVMGEMRRGQGGEQPVFTDFHLETNTLQLLVI